MVSGTDRERRAVALGLCHNRVTLCGRSGGHRALPGDAEESLDRPIGHRGYRFARCPLRPLPWRSQEEASPSPVYGAALLMRFGLIAHRGFKSLRLRHRIVASDLHQRRSEVFSVCVACRIRVGPSVGDALLSGCR